MQFYTKYERPKPRLEFNTGESKTETAGYIPPKIQIEQMIMAGIRLNQYRQEAYDFKSDVEVDDTLEDPTRAPNFDLADASALAERANANLKKARLEAARQKKEKEEMENLEKSKDPE